MGEYISILKEMSKEKKIIIRNIIGGNGYGGKREKKGGKMKKVGPWQVRCVRELI